MIDHANMDTAKIILNSGYYTGLTVQVGKLSEKEVYEIVSKYGVDKFVLNSDTGFDKADMLATVKAVRFLLDKGIPREDVKKTAINNGLKLFKI